MNPNTATTTGTQNQSITYSQPTLAQADTANILNAMKVDEVLTTSIQLTADISSLYYIGTADINYKFQNRTQCPQTLALCKNISGSNTNSSLLPYVGYVVNGPIHTFAINDYYVAYAYRDHMHIVANSLSFTGTLNFIIYVLANKNGRR